VLARPSCDPVVQQPAEEEVYKHYCHSSSSVNS